MKTWLGKIQKSLWLRLLGIVLLFVLLAGILISGYVACVYQEENYYEIQDIKEEFAYSAGAKGIAINYVDEIYEDKVRGFPSSGVWMIENEALDLYLKDKNFDCWIYQKKDGDQKLMYSSASIGNAAYPEWERVYKNGSSARNQLIIRLQLKLSWDEADRFASAYESYKGDYENRYIPIVTGGTCLVLFFLVLRYLVLQKNFKALKERAKELAACQKEGWTAYLPLDLVVLVWVVGLSAAWYMADALVDKILIQYWNATYDLPFWQNMYVAIVAVVLELLLSAFLVWVIVVRKRQGTLKKGLICIRLKNIIRHVETSCGQWLKGKVPLRVNLTARFVGLALLEMVLTLYAVINYYELGQWFFLFIIVHGLLLVAFVVRAFQMQKLWDGAKAIAQGDLSYQIDTKGMKGERLELAEHLNSIGEGMAKAVHESIKSERMKTELITNVSHDIKTPLTSIINYVDLLQKEHTPEQEKEYLEVLVRQSAKLKKLTEDVLEASKAASGNVEVHLVPLSFKEVVNQAAAEYEGKLAEADLKLVWKLPEEELSVLGDGKLMWRVLDNLFGNVCKYSLKGTRVYVEMARFLNQVTMTMKNVSAEELNVSAEELTERFVRGDKSRSTEGSGLGLNIAMSFMKLQGGDLELEIDGDLFKVKLTMPAAEEREGIIPPIV